jgi:ribosome-binding factor A
MAYRKEKLEEQIKRIVSELLIREIKDPRIGFATITGVELSKDRSQAKIGVSVLGDPRDLRKTMEGLHSALPYIQHRMGKALGIRVIPRISFFTDSSIVDGVNMVHLLNKLEEAEKKEHTDGEDDEAGPAGDQEQE